MSKFRGSLREISAEFHNIYLKLNDTQEKIAQRAKKSKTFLKASTLEEVSKFAEKNFRQNINQILKIINAHLLPAIFKQEFFTAIVKSKEFNIKEYYNFVKSVQINSDLIRATYENKKIELKLNEDRINLFDYANAVIKARKALNVRDRTPPEIASMYWMRYYRAAREGRRVTEENTAKLARNYWRMIKTRISFFPPDSIPFFYILEQGTNEVKLASDRGGIPYPRTQGYSIRSNVNQRLVREVENLKKTYVSYLEKEFLALEIEIPDEYFQVEELNKMVVNLVEKGIPIVLPENIVSDTEMLKKEINRGIRAYFQKLGYKKVSVDIIKRPSNLFSLIARTADGRFAKWRL